MEAPAQIERIGTWTPKSRQREMHARKPFRCCDCARHFRTEDKARRHWRDSHARKS